MGGRFAFIAALLLAGSASAAHAQMPPGASTADFDPAHMTGAEPISPADYAKLPKLGHHRAWLPKTVDLSTDYPEPGTQGAQPNCVAWATTYAARSYLLGKDIGRRPTFAESLSPAYVYNRLRPPGTVCWGTLKMVDALDMLKTEGTVPLGDFPDDMLKCKIPAAPELKVKAANYRIDDWRAINRVSPDDWRTPLVLDDVKGALSRGVPVVFAMPTGFDFSNFKGGTVYDVPAATGRFYHAMAVVGYDEDKQAFRVINSWGPRWGDGGYAWISYGTFQRLAGEAYALEAPAAPPTGPAPSPKQQLDTQLATFQCGSVALGQDRGKPVVTGFGGVQSSLDALRKAALAAAPDTVWQVAYHPWPQCEAETTLAQPLRAGGVTLAVESDAGQPRAGDPVAMHAGDKFGVAASTTPDKPYLSIVYLQADGSAVELYRGEPAPGADGKRAVVLGTGGPKAMRFEVASPYGDEILIALASAQPLFGVELRTYATERQFLTALRAHLLAAPRGGVSAAVLRLKTAG